MHLTEAPAAPSRDQAESTSRETELEPVTRSTWHHEDSPYFDSDVWNRERGGN
jgi:hypothetical protein